MLGKNLVYLRRKQGLTQEALAVELGINRSRLANHERGKDPRPDMLKSYSDYFNVNIDELLTKDLERSTDSQASAPLRVLAITVDEQDNENIEYVPVKAAAGYAVGYGDPEFIRELPKFRLPFLSRGMTYRAFEITGDSMLPIPSGSVVVGQYVEDWKDIKKGDSYIFITINNGIVFKRVADIGNGQILLKSDNPLYDTYSLPLSEIKEAWKAKVFMSFSLDRN